MQAKNNRSETVPVYEHLTDLIETTLCPKGAKKYHDKAWVNRTCESCGIDSLQLLEEEIETTPTAPKVKWQRFEYVQTSNMKMARRKENCNSLSKKQVLVIFSKI